MALTPHSRNTPAEQCCHAASAWRTLRQRRVGPSRPEAPARRSFRPSPRCASRLPPVSPRDHFLGPRALGTQSITLAWRAWGPGGVWTAALGFASTFCGMGLQGAVQETRPHALRGRVMSLWPVRPECRPSSSGPPPASGPCAPGRAPAPPPARRPRGRPGGGRARPRRGDTVRHPTPRPQAGSAPARAWAGQKNRPRPIRPSWSRTRRKRLSPKRRGSGSGRCRAGKAGPEAREGSPVALRVSIFCNGPPAWTKRELPWPRRLPLPWGPFRSYKIW